jgi:hypothetical protein
MRLYLSLPALACVALLGFSAGGARAGHFFGPVSYGADYRYQYPNPSYNSFMPGSGIPPVYGVPIEYMQAPMVPSPIQTPPIPMTSVAPTPLPVAPAVQNPPCQCGQSGQVPAPVPTAPAVVPSPILTPPIYRTSVAPAPLPVAPPVRNPPCQCGR